MQIWRLWYEQHPAAQQPGGRAGPTSSSWSVERRTDEADVVDDENSGDVASRRRSVLGRPPLRRACDDMRTCVGNASLYVGHAPVTTAPMCLHTGPLCGMKFLFVTASCQPCTRCEFRPGCTS